MSNDDIGPSSPQHCSVQVPPLGRGVRAVCWPGAAWCQPRRVPGSCALCRCHHGHCVLRSEIIHHQVTSPRSGVSVSTLPAATAASSCTRPSLVRRHLGVSTAGPGRCEAAPDLAANSAPPSLSTCQPCTGAGRGRGWSTPELTSDCPLQLDTVRSLILQSSLRSLV